MRPDFPRNHLDESGSIGALKLNDLTAMSNSGVGVRVANHDGATLQAVTLAGSSQFKANSSYARRPILGLRADRFTLAV